MKKNKNKKTFVSELLRFLKSVNIIPPDQAKSLEQ